MLPYGTRFGVFDNSGRWLYGTFTESEREEVWKAVLEEKNEIRSGYLKRFQREEEICLVSYQLRVQFGNPALRERFPHVLELLLLAALLIFCAEVMFLIRYFSRKIKQELQKIEWMTEKLSIRIWNFHVRILRFLKSKNPGDVRKNAGYTERVSDEAVGA